MNDDRILDSLLAIESAVVRIAQILEKELERKEKENAIAQGFRTSVPPYQKGKIYYCKDDPSNELYRVMPGHIYLSV